MMRRVLAAVLVAGLGAAAAAAAQKPRPAPRPAPPAAPAVPAPTTLGRICSTAWGACPLPATIAPGTPCYCWAPPNWWLPGVARELPPRGPWDPWPVIR
ncbi:MAG: hypothetical protein A3I14_03620 [Candidatus Rokubacteria bacterium RIFCSPLOWO2_02_FULL_73_56]|nr:MAG: hypothetical protein A3I14_03620 [Candidatus Rokubacteria bacterium RIFCSPLOWO2_02_FULL_73_56]